MVRIAKMRHFNIYSNLHNGFIVHNTRKEFSEGHTHINSFSTAKYVAYLALYQKLPKKNLSPYLIESVIRISSNPKYIQELTDIKNKRN